MSDIAIRAEGLSKSYRIGVREPYKTLRDTLTHAIHAPFRAWASALNGGRSAFSRQPPDNYIWALKDISFNVKRGEVVGIIGRNGAGKTTLLKILSRITKPTEGYAEVHGRVGSLLEVGTGFHPELTGSENIYLNGAILGMKKQEINRKFDEIVAFAEIERFIDTPVKRYSSGMYMRLAFAVAAHLEPEILLVDEVLAVGDVAFQKKCLGKMGDVAKEGRTVLFVSHNMGAINRLCQRTLWVDEGHLKRDGITEEVVSSYLTTGSMLNGQRVWEEGIRNPGVSELRIQAVRIRNGHGSVTAGLDVCAPFWVEVDYQVLSRLAFCRVGVLISTVYGVVVLEAYDADDKRYQGPREPVTYTSRCKIPGNLLSPGHYFLSINAGIPNVRNLAFVENVLTFDIEDTSAVEAYGQAERHGVIRPALQWEREVIAG